MARDVAKYLAELKNKTGRSNTTIDTLIFDWLNDLFEKVKVDPNKYWFLDKKVQIALPVGPSELTVPTDFEDEYTVHLVDTTENTFTEIFSITEQEVKKKFGPSDTGEPERYTLEGTKFTFWPRTNDVARTIELSYKSFLPEVALTTDINDFMIHHHGLLMDGLQAFAWEYLGQEDRSLYYWTKWNQGWIDLRASNISRSLPGEISLSPRTDARGSEFDERDGTSDVFGGR